MNDVVTYLQTIASEIKARVEQRHTASGSLANSIRVDSDNESVFIEANDYIYFLEYGRRPTGVVGKSEPTLLERIKQWCRDKNINERLAYAITKKIHDEGTAIYRGEKQGLGIAELLDETEIASNIEYIITNNIKAQYENS